MLASFLRCHSKGACARDKNTSARLHTKYAGGGLMREGGVFAGHYGYVSFMVKGLRSHPQYLTALASEK